MTTSMQRPLDEFVNVMSDLRVNHELTPAGMSVAVLMLAHEVNDRAKDPAEARQIFTNILDRMCPTWRDKTTPLSA